MEGRTTIIVAHRLSTIALADEIVVLEDGRVAARGRHDELVDTNPVYAEIWRHGLVERTFVSLDEDAPAEARLVSVRMRPIGVLAPEGTKFSWRRTFARLRPPLHARAPLPRQGDPVGGLAARRHRDRARRRRSPSKFAIDRGIVPRRPPGARLLDARVRRRRRCSAGSPRSRRPTSRPGSASACSPTCGATSSRTSRRSSSATSSATAPAG